MLLIGFTMMAVAGGVVAKRLVDAVALVDVLGVAASMSGVILVIVGWRLSLAGIARRWARVVIAILSTLLVAQFLLLPAGVALDVTNRPRPTGSSRTPADVGLRFQDVRIRSADGTLLSAWWITPQNGAAIVLLPGSGSTRHAVLDHAALVARHGYGALLLDWRGHGHSGGRSMEFGWGAEADVRAAVSFVLSRAGVTRGVGVLGLSLGGEVGLAATALDPRIDAAVVEGVSARSWADARLEPDPHPVGYVDQWLTFVLVDILAPEPRPLPLIDLVPGIEAPVLMISGAPSNERKLDPVYTDAAPDAITLWSLPDTPHTQALRTHPVEYERRVMAVFDGSLLGQRWRSTPSDRTLRQRSLPTTGANGFGTKCPFADNSQAITSFQMTQAAQRRAGSTRPPEVPDVTGHSTGEALRVRTYRRAEDRGMEVATMENETIESDDLRGLARSRLVKRREFIAHLAAYTLVNVFLVAVWAFTGAGFFWPVFPIFGWGIGVFFHGWDAFSEPLSEDRIDQEVERLRRSAAR